MRSRRQLRLRLLGALVISGIAVVAPAGQAGAHPLGNFTVNTYAGLSVESDRIAVDFVVDMAEIPAYQVRGDVDADGDGQVSGAEGPAWAARTCTDAARSSQVRVDGKRAPLSVETSSVTFPPGSAGLATLRLTCGLTAPVHTGKGEYPLVWRSSAFTERVGWREVVAAGSGTSLVASDVPATSSSDRLTRYPADLLSSPLDQRSANLRVRADGGTLPGSSAGPGAAASRPSRDVSAALPRGVDAISRSFTDLVARRDLTLAFGALAIALAVGLGAIHALAPGHGKTVMAAYLVGQRGSLRQAGVIALTVTTTHTVGVLVLGLVLSASTSLASESIYPWLGLISGAMLAAVGLNLLRLAIRGRGRHVHGPAGHVHGPSGHVHGPAGQTPARALEPAGQGVASGVHVHQTTGRPLEPAGRILAPVAHVHGRMDRAPDPDHSDAPRHDHRTSEHPTAERPATDASDASDAPMSRGTLVAMGVAGGLVPSPSALVVLLGALALDRAWFGVLLVVAYGAGMALTLTAAGLLLVRARRILDRRAAVPSSRHPRLAWLARAMPAVTASFIVAVGIFLAGRGVAGV